MHFHSDFWKPLHGAQSEVGHNLRWNSDRIMRRAAMNEKRIYHFSIVNGHLSFGAAAAICATAESFRRFKSLLL
jgi:hypothetical protein